MLYETVSNGIVREDADRVARRVLELRSPHTSSERRQGRLLMLIPQVNRFDRLNLSAFGPVLHSNRLACECCLRNLEISPAVDKLSLLPRSPED